MLEDLANYLMEHGIGKYDPDGTTGDIYINSYPPNPIEIISIFDRGGVGNDGPEGYAYPSIQILVRGTEDPFPARERAEAIRRLLDDTFNQDMMGSTLVIGCHSLQGAPNYLGRDQNGNAEYSLNFDFQIKIGG